MRYKYVMHENGSDIKEINSDLWVATNVNTDVAKRLTKHLKLGGGFDGFTPNFFVKK